MVNSTETTTVLRRVNHRNLRIRIPAAQAVTSQTHPLTAGRISPFHEATTPHSSPGPTLTSPAGPDTSFPRAPSSPSKLEPSSPITTSPVSSSELSHSNSRPQVLWPPSPNWQSESCLQCHVQKLRCSFTVPPRGVCKERFVAERPFCCDRCVRNGEDFCILQVVEETHHDRYGQQLSYAAYGVGDEVVREKVVEIVEEEASKSRWALPRPANSLLQRALLKRAVGTFDHEFESLELDFQNLIGKSRADDQQTKGTEPSEL